MKKDSFEKRLAAYVAMGAAFLAAPKESDAQIVYTNVNPDSVIGIGNNTASYYFDLNSDGINDFELENAHGSWTSFSFDENLFIPLYSNQIAVEVSSTYEAVFFDNGDTIGNANVWQNQSAYQYEANTEKFIGLLLKKNGANYYGWLRLTSPLGESIVVKDYAFNTIPDSPIICGQILCDTSISAPTILWNGAELIGAGIGSPQWFLNGDTLSGYNSNNISPPRNRIL